MSTGNVEDDLDVMMKQARLGAPCSSGPPWQLLGSPCMIPGRPGGHAAAGVWPVNANQSSGYTRACRRLGPSLEFELTTTAAWTESKDMYGANELYQPVGGLHGQSGVA